jgi:hypothetical protein
MGNAVCAILVWLYNSRKGLKLAHKSPWPIFFMNLFSGKIFAGTLKTNLIFLNDIFEIKNSTYQYFSKNLHYIS